jgi:hypothetical protein
MLEPTEWRNSAIYDKEPQGLQVLKAIQQFIREAQIELVDAQ